MKRSESKEEVLTYLKKGEVVELIGGIVFAERNNSINWVDFFMRIRCGEIQLSRNHFQVTRNFSKHRDNKQGDLKSVCDLYI